MISELKSKGGISRKKSVEHLEVLAKRMGKVLKDNKSQLIKIGLM